MASFEQILGLKTVLMGFGLDSDAIHSPNEHYGLFNYFKGIETIRISTPNSRADMPKALRGLWSFVALFSVLALQGCLFQDLEVLSVEEFEDVQLLNGFQAKLVVDVYNPNPYPVTVFEADVDLKVEDQTIGEVSLLAHGHPT